MDGAGVRRRPPGRGTSGRPVLRDIPRHPAGDAGKTSATGLSDTLRTTYGDSIANLNWVAQAVEDKRPNQLTGALLQLHNGQTQACTQVTREDAAGVKAYCGGTELPHTAT